MKTFIFITLLIPCLCLCQKQGNIWYFGNKAGLNFNNNPPTPLLDGKTDFPSSMVQWNEGYSSICDSSGKLLFYSNGNKIWDKNHNLMPNGDSILGHTSSTQSCIIVPLPNSSRFFYLFTTDASENSFKNGLRYNIIDICLNNNLGDVIQNKKNIKLIDSVAEKLICIKHSTENYFWIITHGFKSDAYYAFKLLSTGVKDTIISNTGTIDPQGWGGQMVSSPNGQKIVYVIPNAQSFGKTILLSFNESNGKLSNEETLSTGGREWGASFSPDNSKLYFSTTGFGELFQYNLNAGNLSAIIASKKNIISNGPDSWRHHQLGPDGKIYISRNQKKYLSMIQLPDSIAPNCNYIDSAIYLGGQNTSYGLPNYITNYKYTNHIYDCQLNSSLNYSQQNYNYQIYPIPFQEKLNIEIEVSNYAELTLYSILSQKIISKKFKNILELKTDELKNGVYIYELKIEDKISKGTIYKL